MYTPKETRYDTMNFRRCGRSGLRLPAVSLGLWHNFGDEGSLANMEKICHTAFDNGITYFDLANNYGSPYPGSAEENFGKILRMGLGAYRDELIISTKAGYEMWPGPYGGMNGSRKYLMASLDQSLRRMGLDYVDIFYHHVFDPETPLAETAVTLDHIVRQGKALYVGISNYNAAQTEEILAIFRELKTPFVVNQPSYSMLNRWVEEDGLDAFAQKEGFGLAVFSPLQQGLLTNRYLNGIPADSRVGKGNTWLGGMITPKLLAGLEALNAVAAERDQSLAQLALTWVLRNPAVTTVIMGASRPEQVLDNLAAANAPALTEDQCQKIESILAEMT
ncbi:MAG: aldo/keto reductase [Oscillospiraceae bacterium]|nr:aldo/keto reductase [Oscillospiraceae bacterium]